MGVQSWLVTTHQSDIHILPKLAEHMTRGFNNERYQEIPRRSNYYPLPVASLLCHRDTLRVPQRRGRRANH